MHIMKMGYEKLCVVGCIRLCEIRPLYMADDRVSWYLPRCRVHSASTKVARTSKVYPMSSAPMGIPTMRARVDILSWRNLLVSWRRRIVSTYEEYNKYRYWSRWKHAQEHETRTNKLEKKNCVKRFIRRTLALF